MRRAETAPPGGEGAADREIARGLARARRRRLAREVCLAALVSALVNGLFATAGRMADRWFSLALPAVAVGPPLFVVLLVLARGRARVPRVASWIDARLGFHDRLASWVDFRGRADVDPGYRSAQAAEAAAALRGADVARAARVPLLLWAGPLLFAYVVAGEYFPWSLPPPLRTVGPPSSGPGPAFHGRGQAPPGEGGGSPRAGGGEATDAGARKSPPAAPAKGAPPAAETAGPAPGQPPAGAAGEGAGQAPPHADGGAAGAIPEPPRLFSQAKSRELTPVAEPGAVPRGGAPGALPELPLRGRISFNLVPEDAGRPGGPGGAGKAGGGKAAGLEVTLDFDAVPPEYRVQVRRYFDALARLLQEGSHGT